MHIRKSEIKRFTRVNNSYEISKKSNLIIDISKDDIYWIVHNIILLLESKRLIR
jgi:adenylylsulfate kinase-like enzyme